MYDMYMYKYIKYMKYDNYDVLKFYSLMETINKTFLHLYCFCYISCFYMDKSVTVVKFTKTINLNYFCFLSDVSCV